MGVVLPLPLRLHRMSTNRFSTVGCVLLPLWGKNRKQGELRLWLLVRISTVFGTMAETGAFIFGVAVVRNFIGVK